mmetsp:Transcript_59674/g.73077  ORF Transcript_59674/g.73077 Transcript_59674/m.73077 type:complete len:113 (+) Transcript_59674:52-390(+)|eukprot:CAMPEP_0114653766 /NCGR_PEP_ID=MMETSP0191-20121206/10005_1 /TAXON_ID=126664 /ORGANISM="Sorites sp." /LENGTH=112 /DNA_ID=CAMNT_0001868975 /DNA_START=40 /DNA_END=378 /DNA_ORIENTATION=+
MGQQPCCAEREEHCCVRRAHPELPPLTEDGFRMACRDPCQLREFLRRLVVQGGGTVTNQYLLASFADKCTPEADFQEMLEELTTASWAGGRDHGPRWPGVKGLSGFAMAGGA